MWLGAVQAKAIPTASRPLVAVFAANHGVAAQGVSPYPASVTAAMVANFAGRRRRHQPDLRHLGLGLKVFELALEIPTADITRGPAHGRGGLRRHDRLRHGGDPRHRPPLPRRDGDRQHHGRGRHLRGALRRRGPPWVGRGTGVDDAGYARKVAAVEQAVALHQGHLDDPLEVLRRLGGREVAAMVGAILAARIERIPVILDGYVVCAAAAVLHALDPAALDHCVAGHRSAEGAHGEVLRRLGKEPLLDLGMRLGEGTGAALAAGIVRSALAAHTGMATFAQAGVANKG